MFARFDGNPAMTLQDIKKRYGRTHGQRENSIPTTNKVCGGYKMLRTDGRMDNEKTVYPPQTKFAGGYNKEHKRICNTTSSNYSSQSTHPVGRVLWKELLVLSRFHS